LPVYEERKTKSLFSFPYTGEMTKPFFSTYEAFQIRFFLPEKWDKKMERSEHGNRSDTNTDYPFLGANYILKKIGYP
jgi:hypothetical protein